MRQELTGHIRRKLVLGACVFLATSSSVQAETTVPSLTDDLMNRAVGYIGAVTGRDVAAEDSGWLKQQWSEEYEKTPAATIGRLDEMAVKLELIERDADPIAMASYRNELIDSAHCGAQATSDPVTHRARDILAPNDVVLAADCVYGFVVTTFDVEGLAASHDLMAEIIGQSLDPAADKQNLTSGISDDFETWNLANKELAAAGEVRHAVVNRFWSLIPTQKQTELAATLKSQAAGDGLMSAARNLETLALQKIGEVDRFVEEVGDAKLTNGMIGTYLQWLQLVAGYPFSMRDRVWLRDVIVEEFKADPAKAQQEVAAVQGHNKEYNRPPARASEQERLDWQKSRAAMLAGWAAQLHCYLTQSSDPDERHLDEVLFRHDPVIEADCASGRVTRKSDTVLAEAGGQVLTETMLVPATRVATLLFGRSLTEDEATFARDDFVGKFEKDPAKALAELVDYQKIMQTYDGDNFFANRSYHRESKRWNLFVAIYCSMQQSDDPDVASLATMLKEANAVVRQDCSQQVITTERAIDAFIASTNFLAFVSDKPPYTQAEEAEMTEALRQENLSGAETGLAALTEWWSLLSTEKKAKAVDRIKSYGIDHPSEAGPVVQDVSNIAQLEMLTIQVNSVACQVMALTAQHDAATFAIESGPYAHSPDSTDAGIGFSGAALGNILANTQLGNALCG